MAEEKDEDTSWIEQDALELEEEDLDNADDDIDWDDEDTFDTGIEPEDEEEDA